MQNSTHSGWAGEADARRLLEMLFHEPGSVVELRAIGVRRVYGNGIVAGYFDHPDALISAATDLDGEAEGVYVTLNPVEPALLARAANRVIQGAKLLTDDHSIVCRRRFLIDVDPVRPSGISASNDEKQHAFAVAREIAAFLPTLGFPEPLKGDSGNGAHLQYAIELPAQDGGLIAQCLVALAFAFDTAHAHVDQKVFNPARISKLYGTLARKGDNTSDRPHRRSKVQSLPSPLVPVTRAALEALSKLAPTPPPLSQRMSFGGGGLERFDIDAFLSQHCLKVYRAGPWKQGRRWILRVCPFNSEHNRGEAYVVQHENGAIAAGCQHASCAWDWRALRSRFELESAHGTSPGAGSATTISGNSGAGADVFAGDRCVEICQEYKHRIAATGEATLAFDHDCLQAAVIVRETLPKLFAEICELLRAKRLLTDWRKAVEEVARRTHAAEQEAARAASGLPSIMTTNVQLREMVAAAADAIEAKNHPEPTLFVRDRALVRLVLRDAGAAIVVVTHIALYAMLTRFANWFKVVRHDVEGTKPDKDVARVLIEDPPDDLPKLTRVVNAPVYAADGTLINEIGYHADHGVYFDETNAIVIDALPTAPSNDEVRTAVALFTDDLLVDFPFESNADRTMVIGAFLLPFVRRKVPGPTPINLLDAPTPGSGKTLIVKLISIVTTGLSAEIGVLPPDEPETRKRITATLMTSPQIVVFDNAPQRTMINSPVLAALATSEWWTDRVLGVSKNVTVENQALLVLTGNNVRLSMELARRSVRIRVAPKTDRPWERTEFKHPNIEQWTRNHRRDLIRALLILIQNWISKGRPSGSKSLGSFEGWASVIGGILEAAGVEGFLENQHDLYEHADAESEVWREFTRCWFGYFPSEFKTVGELLKFCDDKHLLAEVLGDGNDKSRATKLGRQLKSQRGRIYGDLRIDVGRDSNKTGRTYRVTRVLPIGSNPAPATAVAASAGGGDVGDLNGDLGAQGPAPQASATQELASKAGPQGTFSESIALHEKTEAPQLQPTLSFSAQREGTGERVPEVPDANVSQESEVNYDGGPAEGQGPLRSLGSPPRDGRGRPRQCLVCGSPDFVEDVSGHLVCADCPRGRQAGGAS